MARASTVDLLDEAMNAWDNRGRLKEIGEPAARHVRQWVSPDPADDFVRDLTVLVDGTNHKRA